MATRRAGIMRLVAVGLVFATMSVTAACAPFPLKPQNRVAGEETAEPQPAATESGGATDSGGATEGGGVGGEIYRTGMSGSAPVPFTGGDSVAVASCARCHGMDGKGGVGPAVTWAALTKAGYKDDTVARAITKGVNEKGKPLDKQMPRYAPTKADLAAILAYLKSLK